MYGRARLRLLHARATGAGLQFAPFNPECYIPHMNLPQSLRRPVIQWFLGGLILALGSACAFEPSDAVNDVGTEHTVTVTLLGGTLLDLITGGNSIEVTLA